MKGIFTKYLLIGLSVFYGSFVCSQGYQAIHGSAYGGSTSIFNNPASSIHSAYWWDVTLFSAQLKNSTNSIYVKNLSLVNQDSSYLTMKDGNSSRFEHSNFDASLFNFSYKIDNNHSIGINIRGRTYNHTKTLPFNYADSSDNSFNNTLILNRHTAFLEGFTTHSGWLEADFNYAQVIRETDRSKFSAGITLQIMKSISGAYAKISKLSYLEAKGSSDTTYTFTNGNFAYAYSENYDNTDNVNDFINTAKTSLGLSLGIEYMIYNPEANQNAINNNLNYDWKIGVSLMDLGANVFKPSTFSGKFADPNAVLTDVQIAKKISGANDIRSFRDSLNTVFNATSSITENYSISNPTRLSINIDKNLGNHFYVNGELNINFHSTSNYTKLRTRELNLFTVTPRWETIGLGAYLPVQYNTQGQLWVGVALKMGPLLIGFHNLGLLKKDPTLNGGGYLLLSIHPFNKKNVISKLNCIN